MNAPEVFKNKKILLGVGGGIAAYKTTYLIRMLLELETEVQVVMTESGKKFITPLTLSTLSRKPVYSSLWPDEGQMDQCEIRHIELAEWADLAVIAPATANIIGKAANGLADDLLSTTLVTMTCPILYFPTMSATMFQNPVVQSNIEKLRGFGYRVIDPESGDLACLQVGPGRFPELELMLDEIEKVLI